MRSEFVQSLTELAEEDRRVVLLTGDLGYSVLEPFRDAHPDRFFNVGVAEQNMLGMATGLAEGGFVPFAYSIATFASMRGYEFLRNGAALHRLPVRVVGVGAGFDYGLNGVSHYALEDVALMRAQPSMTVVVPADREQAKAALLATVDHTGPIYFRLAKQGAPVPGLDGRFELDRAYTLRKGDDVALVALGALGHAALEASELLVETGVEASVTVVTTVSPPPVAHLLDLLSEVPAVVTLEDHYVTGGLGSLVAEVIADHRLAVKLSRCGVRSVPRESGSQEHLHRTHRLDPRAVADEALAALAARA
jgi:transketolase